MSRNDDYTTGNLLGFLYHQNYYKLIDIDLSRQTNTSILQQINFTGKIANNYPKLFFKFNNCNRRYKQWNIKKY